MIVVNGFEIYCPKDGEVVATRRRMAINGDSVLMVMDAPRAQGNPHSEAMYALSSESGTTICWVVTTRADYFIEEPFDEVVARINGDRQAHELAAASDRMRNTVRGEMG